VIRSFRNVATEDVFYGRRTKAARRLCPADLWRVAVRKLEYLDSVTSLSDLRRPPKNQLERLRDDREGQWSIRINKQYRVCFVWTEAGPEQVEIVDYH
jgi:proteic killer suppression protein